MKKEQSKQNLNNFFACKSINFYLFFNKGNKGKATVKNTFAGSAFTHLQ
jgi:hypothetical protein